MIVYRGVTARERGNLQTRSERRTRGRAIAALRKKAARFGFTLVEAPA
jgi:hypothetical protein